MAPCRPSPYGSLDGERRQVAQAGFNSFLEDEGRHDPNLPFLTLSAAARYSGLNRSVYQFEYLVVVGSRHCSLPSIGIYILVSTISITGACDPTLGQAAFNRLTPRNQGRFGFHPASRGRVKAIRFAFNALQKRKSNSCRRSEKIRYRRRAALRPGIASIPQPSTNFSRCSPHSRVFHSRNRPCCGKQVSQPGRRCR